jgi:hypothetical protein
MFNWWEDLSGFSGRIQECDYSVGDPLHILVDEYKNVIIRWKNLSELKPENPLQIIAGGSRL